MALPIALTVTCAAALALVLLAELRGHRVLRRGAKVVASAAFIAVAVTGETTSSGDYALWILVGLVLGAIGDIALLGEGRRYFLIGLVAFLLGHLAYVVAAAEIAPLEMWIAPRSVGPLAGAAVVLFYLWPHLRSMKVPVMFYIAAITLMVVGAAAVSAFGARIGLRETGALLMIVGAVLFFASDISVARQRFVVESFTNRLWGLPAYYAGQLLFAWSTIVS